MKSKLSSQYSLPSAAGANKSRNDSIPNGPAGLYSKAAWNTRSREGNVEAPNSSAFDDGFTLVSNAKLDFRPRHDARPAASALSPRVTHAPSIPTTASQFNVLVPRAKPGSSYMKQSCLPVHLRDPVLLAAEQNKGRKIAKEIFKPGMIIRAALHEQHLDDTAGDTDKNKVESRFGAIHTKFRKMIVVGLYQDHYIALPMYTHNGNGLSNKAQPDEFISVKDHRSKVAFANLSKYQALVTETVNEGIELFHPKATLHLTYPVSRKYDLPVVYEGRLDKSSIKNLVGLFNEFAPKISRI